MKKKSAFAELLYVVSNFEKGRVKSSGIWNKKYVKSLESSIEIMTLLTNLISGNKEISQNEIHFLQDFIHKNKGIIFNNEGNIDVIFDDKNDFIPSSNDFEEPIKLMNYIIIEIKNLLRTKSKNYKIKISYLLKAFHNLPKVFLDPKDTRVFNLDIHPIDQQEAVQYAFSYISIIYK